MWYPCKRWAWWQHAEFLFFHEKWLEAPKRCSLYIQKKFFWRPCSWMCSKTIPHLLRSPLWLSDRRLVCPCQAKLSKKKCFSLLRYTGSARLLFDVTYHDIMNSGLFSLRSPWSTRDSLQTWSRNQRKTSEFDRLPRIRIRPIGACIRAISAQNVHCMDRCTVATCFDLWWPWHSPHRCNKRRELRGPLHHSCSKKKHAISHRSLVRPLSPEVPPWRACLTRSEEGPVC
jgi:hypothetical protein